MERNRFKAMLLLCLVLTALPFLGNAQNGGTHFRLGLKTGVNFDQTQGEHLSSDFSGYFLSGFYVGFQAHRFRMQAEALFTQSTITTGSGFKDAFKQYLSEKGTELEKGTFSINELSVPLLFGFNLIPRAVWIEAGPQYTDAVSIKDINGFVKDVHQVITTGYVSAVAGIGIDLPFNFNLDCRYVMGLSDRNNTNIPIQWRSNHFQASLGFSFY